jgi:hypothetical protein
MKHVLLCAALALGAILFSIPPAAPAGQGAKPLELFGVPVKGASREQLRQVLKKNGLRATREDARYWVDSYDAHDVLEGASTFESGYVSATGKFAFAQYTFSVFMDTELVGKVIRMVAAKYGPPSSRSGNYGLGPVTARWNMGQGMEIEVSRGWPDTSTFLLFKDVAAFGQMQDEINAEKKAQEREKADSQSKAF